MNVKKSRSAGGNSKAVITTKKNELKNSFVAQDDNMVETTLSIQDCDIDAEILEVAQEYDRRMIKAVNDCENSLKGGDEK